MGIRSTGSTSISFGLVSVPVKIYTATASQDVKFVSLHKDCGGRLGQKKVCKACTNEVENGNTVKGYEVGKDQYVQFTAEELQAVKPEQFNHLKIEEFVPADTIDPIFYEKSVFVGPDKGGERAFNMLSLAMRGTDNVAIGQYMSRGKVYLVAIRPYRTGLIMQHLFYNNEVRDFDEVPLGPDCLFSPDESDMAVKLVEQLTSKTFDPSKYSDAYREGVLAAAKDKQDGKAVQVVPVAAAAPAVVDLFDALKESLKAEKKAGKKKAKKSKAG